jgi:HPt (histidine-containing phosphotransfer) domain-containing protein
MIFDFFHKKKTQSSSAAPEAVEIPARATSKEPGTPAYTEAPVSGNTFAPVKETVSPAVPEPARASGPENPFYEALKKGNIDPKEGLKYAQNNEELYRILLEEYINSAPEKTEKMKSYFEAEDRKNYTIQVHSLKSTSRTIGATDLSDRTLKLEKAADGGDWQIVVRENAELLSDYELVVKAVSAALED